MGRNGSLEGKEKQEEEKETGGEKKRGGYQKGPATGQTFDNCQKKEKKKFLFRRPTRGLWKSQQAETSDCSCFGVSISWTHYATSSIMTHLMFTYAEKTFLFAL